MPRSALLLALLLACPPLAAQAPAPSAARAAAGGPVQQVFVSFPPAIVVRIDGEPTLGPVPGHPRVSRVTNASVVILFANRPNSEPLSDRQLHEAYYLKVNGQWMTASWLVGQWKPASDLVPLLRRQLDKIADELGQQGVRASVTTSPGPPGAVPRVYVSEVPAQLVLFDGPPRYAPIEGTRLSRATNADHEVLLDGSTRTFYIPAQGVWLSAPALDGPWSVVPAGALPPEVARVPVRPPSAKAS